MENINLTIEELNRLEKEQQDFNTHLSNIDGWAVPKSEKQKSRRDVMECLRTNEADQKVLLSKLIEHAGNKLAKMCLVDAYAA